MLVIARLFLLGSVTALLTACGSGVPSEVSRNNAAIRELLSSGKVKSYESVFDCKPTLATRTSGCAFHRRIVFKDEGER